MAAAKPGPTDIQMLTALLALPYLKERRVFQAMYDSLVVGGQIGLSKKQRSWVEAIFAQHKLEGKPLPKRAARTVDPGKKDLLDFGPLPKKPPGR